MLDVQTRVLELSTEGHTHIIDITAAVQEAIKSAQLEEGMVGVFAMGSTGAISTLEYEPGLVNYDIEAIWEKWVPYGRPYRHNQTWGDDNGAAHIRSFLTGTSAVFPCAGGRLLLGTWQQIVFVDYDTRPRRRKVVVQMMGRFSKNA